MAHRPTRSSGWITGLALCIGLAQSAPLASPHPSPDQEAKCAQAAIIDIELAEVAEVDEVRVTLADHASEQGAAEIVVDAGDSERVIHLQGGQAKTLLFRPALASDEYRISLTPDFSAVRDACVAEVELLAAGQSIATVRP